MYRITLTLERAAGGVALAAMLALLVLTLGAPVRATATGPIIIVSTPAALRTSVPAEQAPIAAEPTPALPTSAPTAAPTTEPPPVALVAESPPAEPPQSQIVVEADGTVRLPGVDDWMANLPQEPEPTAVPAASNPPTGNYCPRCGWRPPRSAP